MSDPVLRVGIIGCGRLTEEGYLPALARTRGLRLSAVADQDLARANHIAATSSHPVRAFSDPRQIIDAGIDAVVVASPAALHPEHAELAVQAEMPVLVEKPPATDQQGARRLAELGPLVSVGFNRRFDANARSVRAAIPDTGPVDLTLSIHYRRASWNPHTVRDDVLLDLMPHLIDWTRWLGGQSVTQVAATEVTPDRARMTLTTNRGHADLSAASDLVYQESIIALGPRGRLARRRRGGIGSAITDRVLRRHQPHPLAASLAAQLEAFEARIRGQHAPDLADAADGLAAMAIVECAQRSDREGGTTIDIATHPEDPPC